MTFQEHKWPNADLCAEPIEYPWNSYSVLELHLTIIRSVCHFSFKHIGRKLFNITDHLYLLRKTSDSNKTNKLAEKKDIRCQFKTFKSRRLLQIQPVCVDIFFTRFSHENTEIFFFLEDKFEQSKKLCCLLGRYTSRKEL